MKCSSFLQKMRLFVVSLCLLSIHLVVGEEVVVKTEKGSIKGASKDIDSGKKSFYEFKGIHYAKAPTGPLRFMVIKATFFDSHCYLKNVCGNHGCNKLLFYYLTDLSVCNLPR